jgi:hypothetical protein
MTLNFEAHEIAYAISVTEDVETEAISLPEDNVITKILQGVWNKRLWTLTWLKKRWSKVGEPVTAG